MWSHSLSPLEAAYRPVDANKGETNAGLPVLGRLEDEVVQRLADLAASGGGVGSMVSYWRTVEDCGSEFIMARRRAYVFWP